MTNQEKLINILKEVFMLDKAELDFGIYKIMNQKRTDIEQFLNKDLLPQIQKILSESITNDKTPIQNALDDTIKQAIKFGVNPDTNEDVIKLKEQLKNASDITDAENEVFSHLATFFKRYFDNGDFIAMRRYKEGVYAIPYAGEEVKLHWANADQYYIKTSEYLKNYRFKLPNGNIAAFLLIEASTEQNNNKTQTEKERKFQLADLAKFPIKQENNELIIPFVYEQTDKKNTQKELNENAFEIIKKQIPADFLQLLELKPTEKDKKRTILQKHLSDYTARNSFDYFIHKELGAFLSREMDFYIKNEILFIDDLNTKSNEHFIKQLTKIKATKNIAQKIITFLAQLEDFQKKLWCKKKFIVATNYCITLDRIPKTLYPEIINNQKQITQWINLFAIDEIKPKNATQILQTDIIGFSNPMSIAFLEQNPFLVLDTAHFDDNFKWQILTTIHDFDNQNNGLLLNSENFQALSLLQARYQQQIKTIYIDPPYNTGNDGFAYKDNFKSSSWLAFMENRVNLSRNLMKDNGVCFTSLDDREQASFRQIAEDIFGKDNFVNNIIWEKKYSPSNDAKWLSDTHDFIICFAYDKEVWRPTLLARTQEMNDRYSNPDNDKRGDWKAGGFSVKSYSANYDYPIQTPAGNIVLPPKDGCWQTSKENYLKLVEDNRIYFGKNNDSKPQLKQFLSEVQQGVVPKTIWKFNEVGHNQTAMKEIEDLFGNKSFSTPKPSTLINRILEISTNTSDILLDYFAGSGTSGHAVINLNREDGGERKYILVEMGEYFETVTKPRIMKVIYSKEWKEGKPLSREGISQCFKYVRLESYEDTLNNLVLQRTPTQQTTLDLNANFKEGYMLNYMLDVESREGLLNLEWFVNPFDCYLQTTQHNELQATKVDMIETFNYLLGLVVSNYGSPIPGIKIVIGRRLEDEGKVLIIWRDCTLINNEQLNTFMSDRYYSSLDSEFSRIYVNGDNNIENLRTTEESWKVVLIEEAFKELMF